MNDPHLAIVIPTLDRPEKLSQCIISLLNSTYKNFDIYTINDNNDESTATYILNKFKHHSNVHSLVSKEHRYVAGCWDWFTKYHYDDIKDIMVWLVDDVEVKAQTLEILAGDYIRNFPNLDGVLGISQECPNRIDYTWKPYGQVLLGKKFIDNYPEHLVCCPDYIHFYQDQEMYDFATSIHKFKLNTQTKILHYHPAFIKTNIDPTHYLSRGKVLLQDKATYEERRKKGYLWGKDFNLLVPERKDKI